MPAPFAWSPATYFANPGRRIQDDPKLLAISWFRRYGANDCFEFFATFQNPAGGNKAKKCWIKYKDLVCNPRYVTFLEIHGWVMDDQEEKYQDEANAHLDEAYPDLSDEEPVTMAPVLKKAIAPAERSKTAKKHAFVMKKQDAAAAE